MIKKIIVIACLFLSLVSFAQEGTSSPYSFYGIGDIRFKGTVESRSMGGVAVEQDSIHINLENYLGLFGGWFAFREIWIGFWIDSVFLCWI